MTARAALLVVSALLSAGCLGALDPASTADGAGAPVPVRDRAALAFDTTGAWSRTLVPGALGVAAPVSAMVPFEAPAGSNVVSPEVNVVVFLPERDGCDYAAESLPDACRVPVVADIGPYYGDGDKPATEPADRLGAFLIENLVPHGFAVAQASVPGTGDSLGCMDLMGAVEQAAIAATVEWLGTATWSSGSVGVIGKSYDGGTSWEAALSGNEHLKTVVPISGLWSQHDLMWKNGSAELRGPGVLWGLYYSFALTGNEGNPELQARQAVENSACPETQAGLAQGLAAFATGDKVVPEANDYWTKRNMHDRILENYRGSVYIVHGMQDWNVDPHMAFPIYGELRAKGLDVKGVFGQWEHMHPDRPAERNGCAWCLPATSVRWDWAQDLLEWFTFYLKGEGPRPELHAEMQDSLGAWRIEESWPPADAEWMDLALGADFALESGEPALVLPVDAVLVTNDAVGHVRLSAGPFDRDLRIAGLPQLHVTVTPGGPGGQLYAALLDAESGARLAHAVMDLRYADGSPQMKPVVPGVPLVARMEFLPTDAVLPAGHALKLVISNTGEDYLPSVVSAPVLVEIGPASVLRLPLVERGADAFFVPPGVPALEG